MLCSLNEIETEVRKAARGARLPWGLAEEAGYAARFLSAYQIPCLSAFLLLFDWRRDRAQETMTPVVDAQHGWRSGGDGLCAITAGSVWQDFGYAAMMSETIELHNIIAPTLLAPFVAATTLRSAITLALHWPRVTFWFCADRMWLAGEPEDIGCTKAAVVTIRQCTSAPSIGLACVRHWQGVPVDDRTWSRLREYAARTYVPTSAASRLYGAGAGLLDND